MYWGYGVEKGYIAYITLRFGEAEKERRRIFRSCLDAGPSQPPQDKRLKDELGSNITRLA